MDTQVRLGEDRLDKDRLDKVNNLYSGEDEKNLCRRLSNLPVLKSMTDNSANQNTSDWIT